MSGEHGLERSVLERKERDELHTIAEALGVKPGTRTKKADLVDQILRAAGYDVPAPAGDEGEDATEKPRRARRATKAAATDAEAPEAAGAEDGDRSPVTANGTPAEADGEQPSSNGSADRTGTARDGDAGQLELQAPEAAASTEATQEPSGAEQTQPDTSTEHSGRDDARARRQTGDGETGDDGRGEQRGGDQRQQQGARPQAAPFDDGQGGGSRRNRRRRGRDRDRDRDFQVQERGANEVSYQGEPVPVAGMLDLTDQGFGFVRVHGHLPSADDVYVSVSQTRRFGLRKGDLIEGAARPPMGNEKYGALLRIDTVSGMSVDDARRRPRFEDLTPLFPDVKLKMEVPGQPGNITGRIIDLISPIGKGQRGLIVSPPKAGKTTVMKHIAQSIETNSPDVHLMVLLVDERPEEVTDMRRTVERGEVWASTFDRPGDEHAAVAELAIERAKRLVELGRDVVIILDGITRLTRAYNLITNTGRLNQGGIDQGALYPPKKFFGAARNLEEGGSLTILATALVETGSKGDEVIFEEFKGTGNMELRLDRRIAERRVFPAIDVNASSTRHEELLFDRRQLDSVWKLRRVLNGLAEDGTAAKSLELLMEKIKTTRSNDEFLAEIAKAQTV